MPNCRDCRARITWEEPARRASPGSKVFLENQVCLEGPEDKDSKAFREPKESTESKENSD